MSRARIGIDYSEMHQLDSPANRLIRDAIWGRDDDIGQQSFITPGYLDEFIRRIGVTAETHLLDVGSGAGGPAVEIATRTGCRVTGVEINQVGVDVGTRLAQGAGVGDRVRFVRADAMDMPFDDASFDAAITLNVMNVFADKVALLQQVHRVLRPGATFGLLSGTFEMPDDDPARTVLARGYLIPQFYDSLASYKQKLIAAGFALVDVIEYIADFRRQVARWGAAYRDNEAAIAAEQGAENTAYHIAYFDQYLALVDEGRASNHFIVSVR